MENRNAELAEDGSLDVEISFHLGDEMQFKAQRW